MTDDMFENKATESDDMFEQPDNDRDLFDRWNRYVLVDPFTGTKHPWTRATTFASAIRDSYALNEWQQRMVVKGMSLRPDLVAKASALDVKKDKDKMNRIAETAKEFAGSKIAANTGTAIHTFAENLNKGEMTVDEIPEVVQKDLKAYQQCLPAFGLEIVPELVERIVCVPQFGVAGKFDEVLREQSGSYVIGDVKSGQNLSYNWLEIAIQLALYAHGLNRSGIYDQASKKWMKSDIKVRTDYAVVIHIPAGKGTCELWELDIQEGWDAAALCADVRERRSTKATAELARPYKGAKPFVLPPDEEKVAAVLADWEERFRKVTSRSEASQLYREAMGVYGARSADLEHLVRIGLQTLGGPVN
jgi:hypothetical protein